MKIRVFIIVTLLILALPSGAIFAQEQFDTGDGVGTSARAGIVPSEQLEKLVIKRDPKVITDGYIETTFPNLVNAYWAVAKFDIDDDQAIDNYMMITNCDIYRQYYNNDFEWEKVRAAARQYLTVNAAKLPTRFEALLPIVLDKYDPKTQQFKIAEKYQQSNLMRVDVLTNPEGNTICGFSGLIPLYPRNIVILLNRPFTVKSFPVNPEVAELYMKEIALRPLVDPQKFKKLSGNDDAKSRTAFLRLKFRLAQYKNTINGYNFNRAVIYAYLEGWDVYADEAETKPLYTSLFKKRQEPITPKLQQSQPIKEYTPEKP